MQTNVSSPKWIVQLNWIDCITLSSVITTSLAVALLMDGYFHASIAILFIAMTADAMDGYLARLFKMQSQFGRYLDGFMDVLIYLVVPSLALYQFGFNGFWGGFLMLMVAAGCIRLSAFNETGNIETSGGPAYMGMPVFWSVFICAGYFVVIEAGLPELVAKIMLAVSLCLFSWNMLQRKPFFKFTSMLQMLSLTLGGCFLFVILQLNQFEGFYNFDPLFKAWILQIPVVVGGSIHMWVVARKRLTLLAIPVSESLYGSNKTWRGFLVMPLASMVGALLLLPFTEFLPQSQWHFLVVLGALSGAAYVMAELPNSFIKRRLGVLPGQLPESNKWFFLVLDQLDSGVGIALVLWAAGVCTSFEAIVYGVSFPVTALVVKSLLFSAGLKRSAC